MVGRADLRTLRTTAAQLDTCVRLRANKLGIQRRPTRRGCRAGRLVSQRHPAADNNAAESENDNHFHSCSSPLCGSWRSRSCCLAPDDVSATEHSASPVLLRGTACHPAFELHQHYQLKIVSRLTCFCSHNSVA